MICTGRISVAASSVIDSSVSLEGVASGRLRNDIPAELKAGIDFDILKTYYVYMKSKGRGAIW